MKPTLAWHFTPWGRAILWLGSIQLAVPILIVVAAALAWGTFLESTQSAKVAKATVYGSTWFIAVMALVCASLVFAVITRFPWKKKHVGFMIVHASLVALIGAGFWSLYGRIEGRIGLVEGRSASAMELDDELIELVEPNQGSFKVHAAVPAPHGPAEFLLGDTPVRVIERWRNTQEEFEIRDDGTQPYRAVEVAFAHDAPKGAWVGEETKGGPALLENLVIRLFPSGAAFDPAQVPAGKHPETLVLFGQPPALEGLYIAPDGLTTRLPSTSTFPWNLTLGARKLCIRQQFTHAKEISHFSPAPDSPEPRPALLVSTSADREPFAIAWKSMAPLAIPGKMLVLRFGPRTVELPFQIRLDKFTKLDYPGTEMAMAYESDVTVSRPNAPEETHKIHMNSPLKSHDWKVYQSGFMGTNISIFSVMKDPGLTLTYLSSITLCIGILISFYSRRLSWGHPGIPAPFAPEELKHASPSSAAPVAAAAPAAG